ncbi:MAG: hypothetical protein K5886_08200 [Lachnospiraceae bacterium]|nr:hypothetical protein [Lachnospiraceae bacterium]
MNGKINDDALNEVNGGVDFYLFNAQNIIGSTVGQPFEVLNARGDKVASFSNVDDAKRYLGSNKYLDLGEDWNIVCQLRGQA